jgi:hypothetical protein
MHSLMMVVHGMAAVDICKTGGKDIVTGFTKIIDVGKWLLAIGAALILVIYLIFEFVQESRSGTDQGLRVSTFIFHHILPVLLLILSMGLLFAFGAGQLLGSTAAPC